jgi:hypothetical protein
VIDQPVYVRSQRLLYSTVRRCQLLPREGLYTARAHRLRAFLHTSSWRTCALNHWGGRGGGNALSKFSLLPFEEEVDEDRASSQ